jgi:hypothetical protein
MKERTDGGVPTISWNRVIAFSDRRRIEEQSQFKEMRHAN